ncbi:MAG: hypothetical protein Q9216_003823 [Gyalolechia sp. 2 TL-2023]
MTSMQRGSSLFSGESASEPRLEQSLLPLDESTILRPNAPPSHAKTPSPEPAASSPQPEAPSPTPTLKRKPASLPTADPENEESVADNPTHPSKRARGRPKGSTKALQAKKPEVAGPVEERLLRLREPTGKGTLPSAKQASHKRGRPKKSEMGTKTPAAGARVQKATPKAVGKTASGVGGKTQKRNITAGETDGIKKRGRPKKSDVGMESNAARGAKKATTDKGAEVKKRGRPKKST